MTTKLSGEQRHILQRMVKGLMLRHNFLGVPGYALVKDGWYDWSDKHAITRPAGQSVNGLIMRHLIVKTGTGYELSPAGREAVK